MILLPLTGNVVYIQPVYLKAKVGAGIPQLKRVIVSTGEMVAMEPSLEGGFTSLERRIQEFFGRSVAPQGKEPPKPGPPPPAPPGPTASPRIR
jgi:hypothetical protein